MKWYDIFSNVYDSFLENLYFESRKRTIELLDLKSGQNVIDIACRTGANFKHIISKNKELLIYGTDIFEEILKKGQVIIDKNNR